MFGRFVLCGLSLLVVTRAGWGAENIARGAKYKLFPAPNYRYCTDPDDRVQLTDGQSTRGYFWTQPGTVGWTNAQYATVTVDLGRVEPIAGAALTTAAGAAGVRWPAEVRILTSDDGRTFRDQGDLVALDANRNGPLPEKYAIRHLATDELRARGRYVMFLMLPLAGSSFTFVDEVEVLRGPADLLAQEPVGQVVVDVRDYVSRGRRERAVRLRRRSDAEALDALMRRAPVDEAVRQRLASRLVELRAQLDAEAVPSTEDLKAILPIGDAHGRLFALQAELWRAAGLAPLWAATPPAWDPLELVGLPAASSKPALDVHLMRGEFRASAVNLVNSTAAPIEVDVRLEGLPGGAAPACVTLAEVPWTDTAQSVPVAAALVESAPGPNGWRVRVLPGLVGQLWLTWHVTDLAPGAYSGTLVAESAAQPALRIPVRLKVSKLEFPPRTALMLGGWSYTNGRGAYGVNPENRPAFLRHVQERFVNTPWAQGSVLLKFQSTGDRVVPDTAELDDWLAQWPDARRYMVFLAVGRTFDGTTIGTPQFDARVAAWISAWVRHLGSKGIAPERLGLLIHDEPHDGTDVEPIIAWARAIHKAEPKVLIWEDPTYRDPHKAPREMLESCNVLCPNRPMWLANPAAFEKVYLDQQRRGAELNLYSCSGPARLLDPYSYYRLQAWHCWQIGAKASFFWALGDNSRVSSWCEYMAQAGPFTPLFIDAQTITAGKHMEAIRESAEDFEYLVMLRRAAERSPRADAAQRLLTAGVRRVLDTAPKPEQIHWHEPKDRTQADAVRVEILKCLEGLSASP